MDVMRSSAVAMGRHYSNRINRLRGGRVPADPRTRARGIGTWVENRRDPPPRSPAWDLNRRRVRLFGKTAIDSSTTLVRGEGPEPPAVQIP